MPTVTVVEMLDVPVDEVWNCIVDVASYPDYMASVRITEVLRTSTRAGDGVGSADIEEAIVGWETEIDDAVYAGSSGRSATRSVGGWSSSR